MTFEKYRSELEQGIMNGFRPHFGYPTLKFNNVLEGLQALNCGDKDGFPDPIMAKVNAEQIEKLQNFLI